MNLQNQKNKLLRSHWIILFCFLFAVHLRAQPPLFQNEEYIETFSLQAVDQMLEFHIPASVIMAQAILESRSGTSDLARRSNNHFGIKCHVEWGGDTIIQHDDTLNECFRRYENSKDSYTDHSLFLRSRARYAALFDIPVQDYAAWCVGLKTSGYATFPNYAEVLINIIENHQLQLLDGASILPRIEITAVPIPSLMTSMFEGKKPELQDLIAANLLFEDEKDLLLRSVLHYVRQH